MLNVVINNYYTRDSNQPAGCFSLRCTQECNIRGKDRTGTELDTLTTTDDNIRSRHRSNLTKSKLKAPTNRIEWYIRNTAHCIATCRFRCSRNSLIYLRHTSDHKFFFISYLGSWVSQVVLRLPGTLLLEGQIRPKSGLTNRRLHQAHIIIVQKFRFTDISVTLHK